MKTAKYVSYAHVPVLNLIEKYTLYLTTVLSSISVLFQRKTLDLAISRAMGLKLSDGRISLFDENDYVLTLDFTLKMLNIHERRKCNVPVIIEGETGVGKTALIEMLSKLWNIGQVRNYKHQVIDSIRKGIVNSWCARAGRVTIASCSVYV